MSTILMVYATEGGNTQMAVETVADLLRKKGHEVKTLRAELADPKGLLDCRVCVLASPTYGHGTLESAMAGFVQRMAGVKLGGKPCAVIALGDSKYDAQYHLEAAPLLERALADAGGKLLLPSLKISGTPVRYLKGRIPTWAEQFAKVLK